MANKHLPILGRDAPHCNPDEQAISRVNHVSRELWWWVKYQSCQEGKYLGHILNELLAEAKASREAASVAARQQEEGHD